MKDLSTSTKSRNSEPVYDARMPLRASLLPPTERRIIAGVETSPAQPSTPQGIFGRGPRHYNAIARMVSAPSLVLSQYQTAELVGAILLACGEDSVDSREGIPSIIKGRSFQASRSADLFFGGTITELTPGLYITGDTIVDRRSGRVYLELTRNGETHVAVIGLFMPGRRSSCVDWRVIERGS